MQASQIFLNGKVLTMDSKKPEASAFRITGDLFCAVGSEEEVSKSADKGVKIVDLDGKTVIPGFIESHNHLSDISYQGLHHVKNFFLWILDPSNILRQHTY